MIRRIATACVSTVGNLCTHCECVCERERQCSTPPCPTLARVCKGQSAQIHETTKGTYVKRPKTTMLSSPQLTCAGGLCTTPEPSISACPHATLGSTGLVIAVVTGEDKLLCVEEAAALSLGIGRGARVSTVHCVCERKEGGGGKVKGGGWKVEDGESYEAFKLKEIKCEILPHTILH